MSDDLDILRQSATPGVRQIARRALEIQGHLDHGRLCAHHWLVSILERHPEMVMNLSGWQDSSEVLRRTRDRLNAGDQGPALPVDALLERALTAARERGKDRAAERDVVRAVLAACELSVKEDSSTAGPQTRRAPGPSPDRSSWPSGGRGGALDKYGRDLTEQARRGEIPPIVGRDEETALVIETLCRRTKRNPVLVGPAGVGKTAVVEGLAQRIVRGEVPDHLRDSRVIALQPSVLTAGASVVGELEKRLNQVLAEARQPGIILFIDEIHSIVGAGGREGSGDLASFLKPVLARGEISCIAATTDDEYRRYIERDEALERRFQPVRVQELDRGATLTVVRALRDMFVRTSGVTVPDDILEWLIEFSADYLRNRNFPDKAVDLLEQCVARGVACGLTEVDEQTARDVAERMVGMPLSLPERLDGLHRALEELGLVTEHEVDAITARLQLSMRGLDLHPERPAAVALLGGETAQRSQEIARVMARTLFGSEERMVEIDLSGYTHWSDTHRLIGAGPGYVGYSDNLPIHALAQMPWSVLLLRGLEMCDLSVRDLIRQAISRGCLTDGSGKKIYLSDAVVLISCAGETDGGRPVGFRDDRDEEEGAADRERWHPLLGQALMDEVDVIFAGAPPDRAAAKHQLYDGLLRALTQQFRKSGLAVNFDRSVLEWMEDLEKRAGGCGRDWERLVEAEMERALRPYLKEEPEQDETVLNLAFSGKRLRIVHPE